MICLCEMEFDKLGLIKKIDVEDSFKRRLMDMGIICGEKIKRVYEDIFKGISAYLVMDSLIAIRNKDVKGIMVSYE